MAFEGIVGTEENFDFGNIWSRNRYVAAAATPTPITIASVETVGIIREDSIERLVGEGERKRDREETR